MTRLIIARHGNTFGPHDVVRRVGITDLPLVAEGLLQGQRLGMALQQNQWIPDVIFTSKLQRTIQTAQEAQRMMNTNLLMHSLAEFNEIDYGPDEHQPESMVKLRLGEKALLAWENKAIVPPDWRVSPAQIIRQWQVFAQSIVEKYAGKTILVVTSNGIARFAPFLTGDFEGFCNQHSIKLSTGAFGVFQFSPASDSWQCLDWNRRV